MSLIRVLIVSVRVLANWICNWWNKINRAWVLEVGVCDPCKHVVGQVRVSILRNNINQLGGHGGKGNCILKFSNIASAYVLKTQGYLSRECDISWALLTPFGIHQLMKNKSCEIQLSVDHHGQ